MPQGMPMNYQGGLQQGIPQGMVYQNGMLMHEQGQAPTSMQMPIPMQAGAPPAHNPAAENVLPASTSHDTNGFASGTLINSSTHEGNSETKVCSQNANLLNSLPQKSLIKHLQMVINIPIVFVIFM
jgi:hypothetical protein